MFGEENLWKAIEGHGPSTECNLTGCPSPKRLKCPSNFTVSPVTSVSPATSESESESESESDSKYPVFQMQVAASETNM